MAYNSKLGPYFRNYRACIIREIKFLICYSKVGDNLKRAREVSFGLQSCKIVIIA